jgi:excinuclease ABC subunit A
MPNKGKGSRDKTNSIVIKGARVHNLKNISLTIPSNKLIVITGLSGSGKSSLAFDTLFAEGQRRYVESLSSYARQFLGKIDKPDVDHIYGISPAIAIEQKVITRSSRSTVGTTTEIYDYLKLLFARIGRTISPVSGAVVKRDSKEDVIRAISEFPEAAKIALYAPLVLPLGRKVSEHLKILLQLGLTRVRFENEIIKIEDIPESKMDKPEDFLVLIDRFVIRKGDEENNGRIADSVQTAFYEGAGECVVEVFYEDGKAEKFNFNNRFEADGITFEEPSVHFFSFNNPVGACKTCEGFGSVIGIDEDLVVPDKSLSVYEDAIVAWKGEKMRQWKNELVMNADKFDFPIHRPYYDLTQKEKELLRNGNRYFSGLNDFFKHLEEQSYKIQYRVMLSRFRGKTICPDCLGTRLRKDASYVKIDGYSLIDFVLLPISELIKVFDALQLSDFEQKVAGRLLIEIKSRLGFLSDVGLNYLTLNRLSNTLSGGESQRINLATSLGSSLVGSMYILDEPSIGLHPRDTTRLIEVLKELKKAGNTVIVVEHDEEIMRAADELIDMGPEAGTLGGEVVFQGNHEDLLHEEKSLTARYLTGKEKISIPDHRRTWKDFIEIKGARENNLKNIDVKFPLNIMTVVTGVSGSGKSTLVKKILYPALKKIHGGYGEKTGLHDRIEGNVHSVEAVEFIDQNPIGKSSRSNPVTYLKAYDEIRNLFSNQPASKNRGFKPSHFSFNIDGGRCETCDGEGEVKIEMQFMADIHLICETCNGKRFKDEILEVEFKGKNIADILDLTVDDAIDFFSEGYQMGDKEHNTERKIVEKLKPLQETGLGYVHLGQSSGTLSGGEAQRIKLAYFLSMGASVSPTLFIFDEPTTGLHFHDIKKLLKSFNALINKGHSLIIIEHNPEIIKSADHIIDLGPEGGDKGGELVFEGTPEELIKSELSYTGHYLKDKILGQ